MQIPIRTIVLGLLITFSAVAVRAQTKAPETTPPINPAATQPSTPLNLALPPAATQPSAPIDLALPPAATQSNPIVPAPQPAPTQQSTPIAPALQPTATQPATPVDLSLHPAAVSPQSGPIDDLALQSASAEVKRVAHWVIESRDNVGLPYLLIDKVNAQVFAFTPAGQLKGAAPALLGMAKGDRLIAPNNANMSQMPPQVRITPAGRFVSRLTIDSHGKELLVLDYDASISLHPVVKGTPAEHRAERLRSATSQDNRVSFGCINVPVAFYSTIVSPSFTGTKGIVYVLPETGPASALFGLSPVGTAVSGAQQNSMPLNARAAETVPPPDAR